MTARNPRAKITKLAGHLIRLLVNLALQLWCDLTDLPAGGARGQDDKERMILDLVSVISLAGSCTASGLSWDLRDFLEAQEDQDPGLSPSGTC